MNIHPGQRHRNPPALFHARFQTALLIYLSGEFRNPLNAIAGYCQVLLEDTIDLGRQDLVSHIHHIRRESARLGSEINNFLNPMTLKENGIEFDPDTIAWTMCDRFQGAFEKIRRQGDALRRMAGDGRRNSLGTDVEKIHQAIEDFGRIVDNPKRLSDPPQGVRDLVSETYSVLSGTKRPSSAGCFTESAGLPDTVTAAQAWIMVVDDHPMNRDLLSRLLERQGHIVFTAADGTEALEMIHNHAFDLILLDILMPGMSGFQVLKRLKAEPVFRSIPVVMISAVDEKDTVIRCIEWGADDYLPKPFNPVLLRARINASIEKKRLRDTEKSYLRKIEEDLTIARNIQKNFLPSRLPEPSGWQIAALFRPARHVAGDFYDVFPLESGGRFGIAVGDVCGKGVSAALFMGLFRSFLRMFSDLHVTDQNDGNFSAAATIVEKLNNFIANHHGNANMFATLFFGILDPISGTLVYVNGGNEPPVILAADHQTRHLTATGPMVGMLPDMSYAAGQTRMAPGDTLVAFTDGIAEAKDPSGNEFKAGYLMEMIEAPVGSATDLVERFNVYFNGIGSRADPFDDLTMLVVKRTADHLMYSLKSSIG